MLDPIDIVFAERLRQMILRELQGDREAQGVIRSIVSAQDWDTVVRCKGIIFAYERVLEMMQEVARKLNEPERREEPVYTRPN